MTHQGIIVRLYLSVCMLLDLQRLGCEAASRGPLTECDAETSPTWSSPCPHNQRLHTAPAFEGKSIEESPSEAEGIMDGCPSQVKETSSAVVLYSPGFLEPFKVQTRTFHFTGRDFTIQQNWADFGVAAVVWDSAIVLCEYLESQSRSEGLSLDGKQVLELGAGTGLVGMVASMLKGHTTITDRDLVVPPLQENINLNFPDASSSARDTEDNAQCASSSTAPPCDQSRPVVRALDWGVGLPDFLKEFPRPFDVILGADIVYIEDTFQALLDTLIQLSDRETTILLSCRIRYDRDERFLTMLRGKFDVEHVFHDDDRGIEIYAAKKLDG